MATHYPDSNSFFGDNSPLRETWPQFAVRVEQGLLAQRIAQALQWRESVALEAPTGTGKTLAYLVPALLHTGRVIISVGNRTLQDHLLWGEYQRLRASAPELRQLVVLKGCENYICRWRLDEGLQTGVPWVAEHWQPIAISLQQDSGGELNSLPLDDSEIAAARQWLTLTADQCRGRSCSQFDVCYFQRARQKAMNADVLLINHRLLLSDQRLFEKGMGALLPTVDAIIVDEAHQLPDLLVQLNTQALEGYRLQRWLRQVRAQFVQELHWFPALKNGLVQLESLWEQIRHQMDAAASDGLVSIQPASLAPLLKLLHGLMLQMRQLPVNPRQQEPLLLPLQQWSGMLAHAMTHEKTVYAEISGKWLRLVAGRVDASFATLKQDEATWIFVSATLAVEGSLDYFKRMLDVPDLQVDIFDGQVNYSQQALLWIPPHLPEPAAENFMALWVQEVLHAVRFLQGGVLMLFSSFDAVQAAAQCMPTDLSRKLLIHQPDGDRHRLLQDFRADGNALLLATGSFWEGIDVAGAALRCIAIDKLPFIAPDDLLALAWKHLAQQQGRQVFQDYMVPQAVMRLRQGVGRLLRSTEDRGLLMLGDTRVLRKAYGLRFLRSLAQIPLASSQAAVEEFLQAQQLWEPAD